LRSDSYKQVLILMELGAEPPRLQFHTIADTQGLELVHAVRQQGQEETTEGYGTQS
jgi:hypothetical protein